MNQEWTMTKTDKPGKVGDKPTIDSVSICVIGDDNPDTSYLEDADFSDRLEAYHRGDFGFVGLSALADVSYPVDDRGNRRITRFWSPGLWGIEDDSGRDYFREVAIEELSDLRDHLAVFGVEVEDRDWNRITETALAGTSYTE